MKQRRLIIALTAGAALSVEPGCQTVPEKEPTIRRNPAPPVLEEPDKPDKPEKPALPSWDSVGSGHPETATNPPRPVLIVDPDGRCFKDWTSGMMAPTPETDDRVAACPPEKNDCGTQVVCPPEAAELLKAHEASKKKK